MSEVVSVVINWIDEKCLKDKSGFELTSETLLLAENILDSLAFLGLVTFLEETFQIKIDEDDMTAENFESPKTVASLIEQLKS